MNRATPGTATVPGVAVSVCRLAEHLLQETFFDFLHGFQLTLMKGDEVVEVAKEVTDGLLFNQTWKPSP